jgi:inorganic phosphate transporter, PiT family
LDTLIFGIPAVIVLAGGLALYMAWAIGANDVANAMGTSVGSRALTIRQAVLAAAIFELGGAVLVGGHVTDTIRAGILDATAFEGASHLFVFGMLAALAAAGTWLAVATWLGWPVSTTHSILGSIVGVGAVVGGLDAVRWGEVARIVLSWITSPLLGGALAFVIFGITRRTILDHPDPVARARRIGPLFFFWVFFTLAMVTLYKGLANLRLDFDATEAFALSVLVGIAGALFGRVLLARVRTGDAPGTQRSRFAGVERIFAVLQILTACSVAFAHGSNDVANSIGPLAAIANTMVTGEVGGQAPVAPWMLAVGGIGIVIGLSTWGYRVMETVGRRITELTPSRGFAAEMAAATTIVLASRLGIPVSTTHILVGAVLGVGMARGIGALDLRVVGKIGVSWLITLPTGAFLAIFFFYFFKGVFAP